MMKKLLLILSLAGILNTASFAQDDKKSEKAEKKIEKAAKKEEKEAKKVKKAIKKENKSE